MPQRVRVTWRGPQAVRAVHRANVRGVQLAGEHLLKESQDLVPLEEGTLERSGTVDVDPDGPRGPEAAVSYDTVYAVPQHENLDYQHAPGRQAKYLEQPFEAEQDTMLEIVAAQVRRATR